MADTVKVTERKMMIGVDPAYGPDKACRVWYTHGPDGEIDILKVEDWEPQVVYLKPQQD